MEVKKIVVHELIKEPGSQQTIINSSTELLIINQRSTELLAALLGSYKKDSLLNAQFDNSPGKYFPEKFLEYQQSQRRDNDFIVFTTQVLGNLDTIIRQKIASKGGYLLFAEYLFNGIDFFAIFLIRDVEGKILQRTQTSFTIETIEYLDVSHLAMACRINESLLNSEQNYLTFTRLRQQEVSDYFIDWICARQLQSSSAFTNSLYEIINQLALPRNPETNEQFSIDEVRQIVYDVVHANPRKEVNINNLSREIYGDENAIREYADENNIDIDTEFRYDKRVLRKFIQVHVKKDGIDIKFSRGDIGNKVRVSRESPNMVIIESAEFAQAIREEEGRDE